MSLDHAVVWIDYAEAHVMNFSADAADAQARRIQAGSGRENPGHGAAAAGPALAAEIGAFYARVAGEVAAAREILIVGPCSAKLFFMQHLLKQDPEGARKVVGVEAVDHPSDAQLLAFARRYFSSIERQRGGGQAQTGV
jgi:hypothetical protein